MIRSFLYLLPLLVLGWLVVLFLPFMQEQQPLSVVPGQDFALAQGSDVSLVLQGDGFYADLEGLLVSSINNQQALVATLPLSGAYGCSFIQGDRLYLGSNDDGIKMLDIANPGQPRLVAEGLSGLPVLDLALGSDYLFVATRRLGILVGRFQDNGKFQQIAEIPTRSTITRCVYRDGFLFVAAGKEGVFVYDVRDVANIKVVAQLESPLFVTDLQLRETALYVISSRKAELILYDVANPEQPRKFQAVQLESSARSLAVVEDNLYVVTARGVSLYRCRDAGEVHLVGKLSASDAVEKLFAGRQTLYMSDEYSALRTLEPGSQLQMHKYFLPSNIRTISEQGDYLYIAAYNQGLSVLKKSKLVPYPQDHAIRLEGPVRDFMIHNDVLYIAQDDAGLAYASLQSQRPSLSHLPSAKSTFLSASGRRIFLVDADAGVTLYDVSAPVPQRLAQWPLYNARQIEAIGHFIVTDNGVAGLSCYDISHLDQPLKTASLQGVHVIRLVARDGYLYVATKSKGIMVLKLTDDGTFAFLSRAELPYPMNQLSSAMDLQVAGGYAYVANGQSGLTIVDVHDPGAAQVVTTLVLDGISKGLVVADGLAYVVVLRKGLAIVDVSAPEQPHLAGWIKIPNLFSRFDVDKNYMYLTRNEGDILMVPLPKKPAYLEVLNRSQLSVKFKDLAAGHYDFYLNRGGQLSSLQGNVAKK